MAGDPVIVMNITIIHINSINTTELLGVQIEYDTD